MTPLLISMLAFVGVAALVGLVAFVFGENSNKMGERLDLLTGRKRKDDEATNILRKTALEKDKNSLLEMLTPNLPSLHKVIVQADCHIKASTLFGIGLMLGILGGTASWLVGVPIYLTPIAGLVMFSIPFLWLWNKRRVRLKTLP